MKRKWPVILAVILIVTAVMATAAFASAGDTGTTGTSSTQQDGTAEKPTLTEDQQAEVKGILVQIQALKEQLIDKFVGYGVLDQEKADAMKERMQERAAKVEENGYLPAFGRHGGMRGDKAEMRARFAGKCGRLPGSSDSTADSTTGE
jgi:hypothetical protein